MAAAHPIKCNKSNPHRSGLMFAFVAACALGGDGLAVCFVRGAPDACGVPAGGPVEACGVRTIGPTKALALAGGPGACVNASDLPESRGAPHRIVAGADYGFVRPAPSVCELSGRGEATHVRYIEYAGAPLECSPSGAIRGASEQLKDAVALVRGHLSGCNHTFEYSLEAQNVSGEHVLVGDRAGARALHLALSSAGDGGTFSVDVETGIVRVTPLSSCDRDDGALSRLDTSLRLIFFGQAVCVCPTVPIPPVCISESGRGFGCVASYDRAPQGSNRTIEWFGTFDECVSSMARVGAEFNVSATCGYDDSGALGLRLGANASQCDGELLRLAKKLRAVWPGGSFKFYPPGVDRVVAVRCGAQHTIVIDDASMQDDDRLDHREACAHFARELNYAVNALNECSDLLCDAAEQARYEDRSCVDRRGITEADCAIPIVDYGHGPRPSSVRYPGIGDTCKSTAAEGYGRKTQMRIGVDIPIPFRLVDNTFKCFLPGSMQAFEGAGLTGFSNTELSGPACSEVLGGQRPMVRRYSDSAKDSTRECPPTMDYARCAATSSLSEDNICFTRFDQFLSYGNGRIRLGFTPREEAFCRNATLFDALSSAECAASSDELSKNGACATERLSFCSLWSVGDTSLGPGLNPRVKCAAILNSRGAFNPSDSGLRAVPWSEWRVPSVNAVYDRVDSVSLADMMGSTNFTGSICFEVLYWDATCFGSIREDITFTDTVSNDLPDFRKWYAPNADGLFPLNESEAQAGGWKPIRDYSEGGQIAGAVCYRGKRRERTLRTCRKPLGGLSVGVRDYCACGESSASGASLCRDHKQCPDV